MKKTKIILALILCAFFTFQAYSQSFSVPSPSAAQITKYGGVSLNESSGRVTTSIPIYKYQAGNLSLPIALSYVGNGVKVDQQSNWVGTNWLLNAGGVVTRIVNHLPDELAEKRIFSEEMEEINAIHGGTFTLSDLVAAVEGTNNLDDLRPDVFSFSFPGYSGAFYLDKNNRPRLMNANSELKIEMQGGIIDSSILNTIVITTPTGLQYFFGGDNASESSSSIIDALDPQATDFNVIHKAITAYYLYKITHPFGEQIILEYHDDGDKEYVMFQGDELIKLEATLSEIITKECKDKLGLNPNNIVKHSIYKGKIYNRKKISRIYSLESNTELRFNSTPFFIGSVTNDPDYNTPQYDDRVLNSIQVYNTLLLENIKQIKLNYLTTAHRIFLEEVVINNDNDINSLNKCASYKMEYDNPQYLPERFSKAQDLLGYYNNKIGNTSFLPRNYNIEFEGVFSDLADRSINFNGVKRGTLKKIEYPSGGYTAFEYEAPKSKALVPDRVLLETYRNQNNRTPSTNAVDTATLGEPISFGSTPLNIPIDQDITVKVNVKVNPGTGNVTHRDKIILELKNAATGAVVIKPIALSFGQTSFNRNIDFHLEAGNSYFLKMSLDPMRPAARAAAFVAKASLVYKTYKQFDAYGIRVKRIKDYSNATAKPVTKRYYYKRAEKALTNDEDEESAVVTYQPQKDYDYSMYQPCCPTTFGDKVYSYISLVSNPFSYFFASADNQVSYKYVTVSLGGDLFEQGGVEKQFRVETSNDPLVFITGDTNGNSDLNFIQFKFGQLFSGGYTDNNYVLNGAPLRRIDIKKKNGALYKEKETHYSYNLEVLDETEGIVAASNTKKCITRPGRGKITEFGIGNIITAKYNNFSYNFNLVSVNTKEYLNNQPRVIPVNTNTSNVTILETEQQIEYGDLKGLPKQVISTNSDGEQHIIRNYYLTPNDLDYLENRGDITSNDLALYTSLINTHRIGTPIQVETYSKQEGETKELKTTQRIAYKSFNGKVLQEKSMTSKFQAPLETNMIYHKYDASGFPLEVSTENDIKTAVIYGYKNKKVIAELVNISYDAIPTAILNNLHTRALEVTNAATMNALETALNQLRVHFPEARITTYVYNKLGQLSSMKDSRGYKISYKYDACYRLEHVKDQEGNIVEEYDYNVINNN